MADMGTREASELWGVSQKQVRDFCYEYVRKMSKKGELGNQDNKRITQDKKGSAYHIPKDFPNPFRKEDEA
ncbi:MAG: hypothetical protein Q4A88_01955 [Clostridia bacterium]|nr:hypothetical protein [Clostridia bacterium]